VSRGINRRGFLASLIAVGATVALPVPPAQATPAQIDQAWDKLQQDPWYFTVDEYHTIDEPGQVEPRIRADVYDIAVARITTIDRLIMEVDQHDELRGHFVGLATDAMNEVQDQLDGDDPLTVAQRRRLKKLEKVLEDPDEGWQDWLRIEGATRLGHFKREIETWLAENVDWSQFEFWPAGWSGQGRAKSFFEDMDGDTLDALGVEIVEGEHPGSTYYAAELRNEIDDANATAAKLELPFRFCAEVA
jgi:hypothetical protein